MYQPLALDLSARVVQPWAVKGGYWVELLLFAAGLAAGAINSLAGGGSFIAFPALLFAGVPPVLANATNTFAALPGYVAGVVGYWRDLKPLKRYILAYGIAGLIGGLIGAEVLLRLDDETFAAAVPWLMLLAVLLFAFGQRLNRWAAARTRDLSGAARAGAVFLWLLLVAICVYGGFFNAGLGIVILAFFALAGFTDIHAMNGLKLTISSIVAAIAVVRFAIGDAIAWYEGGIVFAGTLIGGYLAARLAHFVPRTALRVAIIVYGAGLTAVFFWQQYGWA